MRTFKSRRAVDSPHRPAPFVFRPSTAWIVGIAAGLALALWVVIEARHGLGTLTRRLPQMAIFAILVGAVFVRPCVEVGPDGVSIHNVVRGFYVPFGVLAELGTEFCLTVIDTTGHSYRAWSAPAASRITARKSAAPARDFPRYPMSTNLPVDTSRSDADSIARVIRKLKTDFDGRNPGGVTAVEVTTTWSRRVLVALAVAVLLTVATALSG